ncbi:MAG: hypothetical protein AM325_012820 [Candidatus Thorarchaeota archaeon SMTZ1-45]|nr:MAG: hypothetical protein AM325_14490 [Candidatus Thorarchaeota archaeon SMTZ1-45]
MLLMIQFFDSLLNGILIVLFLFLACIAIGLACSGGKIPKEETIPTSVMREIGVQQEKRPSPTISWREIPRDPIRRRTVQPQRPIPGVSHAIKQVHRPPALSEKKVKALRGGEFVGNRMRFKVKVVNETPYMITDVTVYLLSYPKESLRLAGKEDDCQFSKIEPGGFRSPTFDFIPTQDCVRGDIVAGVSYVDMTGKAHTLSTEPFVIRSVCDLLIPDQVTPEDFALKLQSYEHGEIVIKVVEWTPKEMFEKALRIMDECNFYEVSSNLDVKEGIVFGNLNGLAKGKYTGKAVSVEIRITGPLGQKGASCTIRVSGEDQAMILPAIDDLKERLSAWLCPMCASPLTLDNVEKLRDGKVVVCPFCSVSIGR